MKPDCSPFPDYLHLSSQWTEEQKLCMKTARDFVTEEALPLMKDAYNSEEFPTTLISRMGELGLLGSNLSGYGLPGLDAISYGLIMRELERGDSGLRSFASVQGALAMFAIHQFGSEAQKKEWLPPMGKGEVIGCFGLTEADGGSNPGAMKTTAEKKDGHWLLNGSKMWITSGNLAEISVVWAKTEAGMRGFIVPLKSPGVKVTKMTGKMSLRASNTSELYFTDVKLSEDAILPGAQGLSGPLSCLTQARYGICWGVLGSAEACFDEVCSYVKDRILFSEPLAAKQLIQRKLALMISGITQGQLLAQRLGELKNKGDLHFTQVSMGKQNNCEMALQVTRNCRDILGGNGIMDEYVTMRHMCNLETVITYEGTNDVHLLIMGAEITGHQSF